MKKADNIIKYFKCAVGYIFMRFIALFAKRMTKYENLWLVSERKSDARDNGYHFFKYLRNEQPQINAAYIIDKRSADYERVSELGRVIQPNSLEHWTAFAAAKVCISTHVMGFAPDTYRFALLDRYLKLVRCKKVFLQHGIIMNDLKELYYPNSKSDLFICTAVPEYEFLKNNFNYPPGVIQRLGLCRYDRLNEEHEVKKQILIMPTWRIYLRGLSDEEFIKSSYYKCFDKLLNCNEISEMLERNDFELIFYMHHELQPYTKLFKSDNKRIKIASFDDYDVQDLLMESSVMVTDYSSVFFDFAYMRKPVVYFWFDEDTFFGEHYKKGYFDFYRNGFGPIMKSAEEVIEYIDLRIEDGLMTEKLYADRAESFFCDLKEKHCAKTYNAVCGILRQ